MATNDEIKERHRDYIMQIYTPELDKMLNEVKAEGYKEGQKAAAKKILKAIKDLDTDYDDLKAIIETLKKQFKVD